MIWVTKSKDCRRNMFPCVNEQQNHVFVYNCVWSMRMAILQIKIFCRCNSVPKAKQSNKQRHWNYLTRNSCLKTVRFWVNLSLFFESKLRVTSAISLSKQRASRWCWSTGCRMTQRKCQQRDGILETGGSIIDDRKAPLIYSSFNCSSPTPTTKCSLLFTPNSLIWDCMNFVKLKCHANRAVLFQLRI
jgi:hypothetical protein